MSSMLLLPGRLALLVVIAVAYICHVDALEMEYCSVLNTASTDANSSIYQSNGLCHDFCLQNYAFAVLQDATCWCSNYAPAVTSPIASCDLVCPGYPAELCGGVGLFGYIALDLKPWGTLAVSGTTPSQSTPTSSSSPIASASPTSTSASVTQNVTQSPSPTSSSSSSSSSSSFSSSSSDTGPGGVTTKAPSTLTPVVTVQTITGQVRTVTYMPTPGSTSDSSNGGTLDQNSSQNLNTGQAVGLTVGLVALVALIGAGIFFFFRKRRPSREEEYNQPTPVPSSGSGSIGVQRAMSQNSRFMLGTDGRQVVEGWEAGEETPGSRRSRLMPVDPRLDPFAPVYLRGDGSKSGDSVQTIQDNHDYSRRVHQQKPILRATNPD